MVKAVSTQVMRESDAWTIANGTPSKELMARAARAIFEEGTWEPPVAVVCGKGNNAGDGYAAALLLDDIGIWCELILLEEKFSEDGAYYFQQCMEKEIPCMLWEEGIDLSGYGTILDCRRRRGAGADGVFDPGGERERRLCDLRGHQQRPERGHRRRGPVREVGPYGLHRDV